MEGYIKEAQEKLPRLIQELVWRVSDGGYKLNTNYMMSWQEEPVAEWEEIEKFFATLLTEARKKWLEEEIVFLKKNLKPRLTNALPHIIGTMAINYEYNQALEDQIFRLERELILNK